MGDGSFLLTSEPAPLSRDRDRDRSTPDPAPPSASSKRRWSPCTWRYAIEEVQPELASKPRSSYILPPSSAPRDRDRPLHDLPKKPLSPDKAGHPPPLDGCDQIPAGQSPSRQSLERGVAPKRQAQKDGDEMEDGASRKSGIQKRVAGQKDAELLEERMRRRRKKKDGSRRRVEREGYSDDASKRKKREMTPSELYFCEICAAKASNGSRSPEDESY